jgi:hypothetical protein
VTNSMPPVALPVLSDLQAVTASAAVIAAAITVVIIDPMVLLAQQLVELTVGEQFFEVFAATD